VASDRQHIDAEVEALRTQLRREESTAAEEAAARSWRRDQEEAAVRVAAANKARAAQLRETAEADAQREAAEAGPYTAPPLFSSQPEVPV